MFIPEFGLPPVERPGGFNTVNATGANFRRIIDLSNVDNSVRDQRAGAVGAAGQSLLRQQPRVSRQRQVLPAAAHTRGAVDKLAAHTLTIKP